ncbi:MAG TPA: VOC family protein [Burkholderiales bacterium]|nr:VOC family protein [Burkholderiales bacterium]
MALTGMNHFTVLSHDLEATKAFYMKLLGLEEGYRPPLGFPGAWLYIGDQAVLHIIAGRAMPNSPQGVLDHMAFSATDLQQTVDTLRTAGIAFDLRRQADRGTWQLFCYDPSGARVELDFDAAEREPT